MSTSDVIVLLQRMIVSLAVDQYSHSTPIMLKDESSTAERQHFWNPKTEELLLDAVMKNKAHLSEHGPAPALATPVLLQSIKPQIKNGPSVNLVPPFRLHFFLMASAYIANLGLKYVRQSLLSLFLKVCAEYSTKYLNPLLSLEYSQFLKSLRDNSCRVLFDDKRFNNCEYSRLSRGFKYFVEYSV